MVAHVTQPKQHCDTQAARQYFGRHRDVEGHFVLERVQVHLIGLGSLTTPIPIQVPRSRGETT